MSTDRAAIAGDLLLSAPPVPGEGHDRQLSILMAATAAHPDETGGREVYIHEASRALAALGHSVTLATGSSRPDLPREETVEGVRVVRYAVNESNLATLVWSRVRGLRRAINGLLEGGHTFDLVNCHGPWSWLGVSRSRLPHDTPTVYTFHSPVRREVELLLLDSPRSGVPSWKQALRPFYLGIYKRVAHRKECEGLHRSTAVVCLSDYMKDLAVRLHRIPGAEVAVIPGGVDTGRFSPGQGRAAARAALKLPDDAVVLVTVRRLTARMGVERLISAMPYVTRRVPNALLLIGGKGPIEGRLRRQADQLALQDRVRFVGYIPPHQLPEYYRAADLFVLPTVDLEGFGLVTLEALSCGTPVAGTAQGGTEELLGGFDPEMLLSAQSPCSLGAGIVAALHRVGHAPEETARQCREYAWTYAWSAVAQRLAAAYQGLVAHECPAMPGEWPGAGQQEP